MSLASTNIIRNAITNNKLSHAYLFYGDKGVDVDQHIFEAIKMIIESNGLQTNANNFDELNYFDLKMIKPVSIDSNTESQIKKETVDQAISKLFETSLIKKAVKILYIKDIDLGNKFSLNRLLKFIEEPVDNLVIFMSTNHFYKVISTIRSRSQNVYIKRENSLTKINKIKSHEKELGALLANMYGSINQLKDLDLTSLKNTYHELIKALKDGIKNKYSIKNNVNKIWTKQNSLFVLNTLQMFFYQLMTKIDETNPLFPKQDDLINSYKNKKIDSYKILTLIDKVKRDISHYANFNLQKINLLNKIELLI